MLKIIDALALSPPGVVVERSTESVAEANARTTV